MPHIELKYSDNLELNCHDIFVNVEAMINEVDSSAGVCKSRAYRISDYLHSHVFVKVTLLRKPHRDSKFMQGLLGKLEKLVTSSLPMNCYYSIELDFFSDNYITSITK